MSIRSTFPSAREPDTHYFFTVSRGGRQRRFALRPAVLYGVFAAFPAIAAVYLGATAFLFFRDDVIAGLMARQARQQYAYEDRLAAMRVQLDRVTSRQLLDQDSFEGKVQHLIAREAQLETRTAIVAALGDRIGVPLEAAASIPAQTTPVAKSAPKAEAARRASAPAATGGPVSAASAFAPAPQPLDAGPFNPQNSDKPRPDGFELRTNGADGAKRSSALEQSSRRALADAADTDVPTPARLEMLSASLDRIERRQVAVLASLAAPAMRKAETLKAAIAETGLSPDKVAPPKNTAVGGPFIPARIDPNGSAFDKQLSHVQGAFALLDRLHRALPYLPVRKPLPGAPDVTSNFGYRVDPFLGRAALHSGMDMRAETGTPAHATAAGVIVTAAPSGGYGNLVEIDHGNGLSTRYGHLSAILVSEGQTVSVGQTIGRVGSTGRSTGPHLHYEVRINDEATDPGRFVRASRLLAARD
jgi:murein DD-endopeptidase MepM/ murein hydrolase activator NlpD